MSDRLQMGAVPTDRPKQINHLPSYLLKIRGGCEVDSKGKKAGKGPLIQKDVSATLGVSQDQYLFTPKVLATFEGNGDRPSHKGPGISVGDGEMYTLNSTEVHGVIYERNNMLHSVELRQ